MSPQKIAYFSMEIGLRADLPTYSGGLGVLAGDTLKSAADLGLPVVGVTLLYRKGYFRQELGTDGRQREFAVEWQPEKLLKKLAHRCEVRIEGRTVAFQAWQYDIVGATGHIVPVLFLDSAIDANDSYDRSLVESLYGGDNRYRICQEILLGRGGVKMLDKVVGSAESIDTYHMNEGHAAFLTIELLQRRLGGKPLSAASAADIEAVRKNCVFTTHTPVAAGHDHFNLSLVEQVFGAEDTAAFKSFEVTDEHGDVNMTHIALKFSRYVNGVAKRHGEVSQKMFPGHHVTAITNGIHAATWATDAMGQLFDKWIPEWRKDNAYLRYACEIPLLEIKKAHQQSKARLIATVKQLTGLSWNEDVFTIGFARRAATYKRADLLFKDAAKLVELAKKYRSLQICFAGKAHPKDEGGKTLIENVIKHAAQLEQTNISVVYLPNYDMNLGREICGGVDLWLNNPVKPMEASGTSGMKAALNGIPSLSTLDGWWVEGCVEGVTGWEIEDSEDGFLEKSESGKRSAQAAANLYAKLAEVVLPMYYEDNDAYLQVMRNAIALNGTYFSTQRMVEQYTRLAYQASLLR